MDDHIYGKIDPETNMEMGFNPNPTPSSQEQIKKLKEFARKVIAVKCWDIDNMDGCEIQELAEKLGLIEPHIATQEDLNPEFDEFEVGDTIYKFTDILKGE